MRSPPNLLNLLESPPQEEMSISPMISPIINSFPGVTPPPADLDPPPPVFEQVPVTDHPLNLI